MRMYSLLMSDCADRRVSDVCEGAATAALARLLMHDPNARVEWTAPVHEIESGVVHSGALQVRAQAYTLATSDGFVLIVWVVIVYLLMMVLLRPGKISFNDLRKMQ